MMERSTRQKQVIAQVFNQHARPLSTHEILQLANQIIPQLSLATVYRNIKTFVENGWIKMVEIPGQAPRYEKADLAPHSHFFCEACDKVFDIMQASLSFPKEILKEFEVRGHDCILYGNCKDCK